MLAFCKIFAGDFRLCFGIKKLSQKFHCLAPLCVLNGENDRAIRPYLTQNKGEWNGSWPAYNRPKLNSKNSPYKWLSCHLVFQFFSHCDKISNACRQIAVNWLNVFPLNFFKVWSLFPSSKTKNVLEKRRLYYLR